MEFVHEPVMLAECIEALAIKPDGIYLDGTVGGAGHSLRIAERLAEGGRLIAFDKDGDALEAAGKRLAGYIDKVTFVRDDFANAERHLDALGVERLDGVLLDLGVSSYQLDNAERGFSYIKDAPLDMRMNREQHLDAREVVNGYGAEELERIFREYGEEKLARRIAERIVSERKKKPLETTLQLASLVAECYPERTRWKFGNPAKRVFQAVRVEVNGELENTGFICVSSVQPSEGELIQVPELSPLPTELVFPPKEEPEKAKPAPTLKKKKKSKHNTKRKKK